MFLVHIAFSHGPVGLHTSSTYTTSTCVPSALRSSAYGSTNVPNIPNCRYFWPQLIFMV